VVQPYVHVGLGKYIDVMLEQHTPEGNQTYFDLFIFQDIINISELRPISSVM